MAQVLERSDAGRRLRACTVGRLPAGDGVDGDGGEGSPPPGPAGEQAWHALGTLCHALCMRGEARGDALLLDAVDHLTSTPERGSAAALGAAAALVPALALGLGPDASAPLPSVSSAPRLGPRTHARQRLLWQQRTFTLLVRALRTRLDRAGARDGAAAPAPGCNAAVTLCTLGYVAAAAPRAMVAPHLPALLPELLRGVASGSGVRDPPQDLIAAVLELLEAAAADAGTRVGAAGMGRSGLGL